MIAEAFYRVRLLEDALSAYRKNWHTIAEYCTHLRGALQSTLYFNADTNECLIHSRWPNVTTKHRTYGPNGLHDDADATIKTAGEGMQACRTDHPIVLPAPHEVQAAPDGSTLTHQGTTFRFTDRVKSPRNQILIYNDAGCSTNSVSQAYHSFLRVVDSSIRVLVVNADHILHVPDWESTTRLLVIPGGAARPFYTALGSTWERDEVEAGEDRKLIDNGKGNRRIINYVRDGGTFLGLCAGAYYGAGYTDFDRGGEIEVLDPGALNFFPGVARGPAFGTGTYVYNSEEGSKAAQLSFPGLDIQGLRSYFNGGSFFHDPDTEGVAGDTELLATYDDETAGGRGVPAIIQKHHHHGTTILSGAHVEYQSTAPNLTDEVRQAMEADDAARLIVLGHLLERLTVPVSTATNQLKKHLQPAQLTHKEIHAMQILRKNIVTKYDVIGSTQDEAKAAQDTLERGDFQVRVAKEQTKGRGTNNRRWASPPKVNIYATFSYLVTDDEFKRAHGATGFTPVVALTVAQICQSYGLDPKYKWVNDVLLGDKKCSGTLVETTEIGRKDDEGKPYHALHVGIGFNVNMTEDDLRAEDLIHLRESVTSMKMTSGKHFNMDEVLEDLTDQLRANLNKYYEQGFAPFHAQIQELLERYDSTPQYFDTKDLGGKQEVKMAEIVGVAPNGHLLLKIDGETKPYLSGRILKDNEIEAYLARDRPAETAGADESAPAEASAAAAADGGAATAGKSLFDEHAGAGAAADAPEPPM